MACNRLAVGFANGMKVHIGVEQNTGLIRSVEKIAANVHDLTTANQFFYIEEEVLYSDNSYQDIENRGRAKASSFGSPCVLGKGRPCRISPIAGWRVWRIWQRSLTSGPRWNTAYG